jgi:hypothetical protein
MSHQRFAQMALVLLFASTAAEARADQTIVFFRHGEKPSGGYGQLTCQGLNRALALPTVLSAQHGRPSYLFAPNPAVKVTDPAGSFNYVRPVATIEPAAIRLGMPVNTQYAYTDINGVKAALITSAKNNTTAFVAWEHSYLVKIVQSIMTSYGGGITVPAWISGDYDSEYVVTVNYASTTPMAQFHKMSEGLNGQSTTCPQ